MTSGADTDPVSATRDPSLQRYLNPNLLAVATHSPTSKLMLHLLDSVPRALKHKK